MVGFFFTANLNADFEEFTVLIKSDLKKKKKKKNPP